MKRIAVLLVLLLVPVQAQDLEAHVLAPAQVVVDTVPEIVELAIDEARHDGTPDDAEVLAAQLNAFARGFEGNLSVPQGSAAGQFGLQGALRYAADVADLARSIPGDVAIIEQTRAACEAYGGRASRSEVTQWGEAMNAQSAMQGTWAALQDRIEDIHAGLDPAPMVMGVDLLAGYLADDVASTVTCVEQAEIDHSIPDEAVLHVRLSRNVTWPTGEITITGGAQATGPIHVTGPGLNVTLAPEALAHTWAIPIDESFGMRTVFARGGGLEVGLELLIDKAPSTLRIQAPATVEPGESFQITATVHSPLFEQIAGGLQWSGHVDTVTTLVDGRSILQVDGTDEAVHLRVSWGGNSLVNNASADVVVAIHEGSDPSTVSASGLDLPWIPLAIVAGIGVAILLVVDRIRRFSRRPSRPEPVPPVSVQGGLRGTFAALIAWLIGRGSPRGLTARKAADEAGIPAMREWVPAFEEGRYGPGTVPEELDRKAPGFLTRWLRRRK